VELAAELADQTPTGFDDLTLAAVAARAGVAVPSLYKHVGSLADLQRAVALVGVRELARRSVAAIAGRSGAEAVRSLAHAVRALARERPGLYLASQRAPALARAEDVELLAASAEAVDAVEAALRPFALDPDARVDAVRAVRAAVHGFVALEAGGGFGMPRGTDASFDALVGILVDGLQGGAFARG